MTIPTVKQGDLHLIYGSKWQSLNKYMIFDDDVVHFESIYRDGKEFSVAAGIDPLAGDASKYNEYNPPAVWSIFFGGRADGNVFVHHYDLYGTFMLRNVFAYLPAEKYGNEYGDKYFLKATDIYTYPEGRGQQEDWSSVERHYYLPDGYHEITTETKVPGALETKVEEFENYDTSGHWQEPPEFGDWEAFTRSDRFKN